MFDLEDPVIFQIASSSGLPVYYGNTMVNYGHISDPRRSIQAIHRTGPGRAPVRLDELDLAASETFEAIDEMLHLRCWPGAWAFFLGTYFWVNYNYWISNLT